jgi:hypothetical protein
VKIFIHFSQLMSKFDLTELCYVGVMIKLIQAGAVIGGASIAVFGPIFNVQIVT